MKSWLNNLFLFDKFLRSVRWHDVLAYLIIIFIIVFVFKNTSCCWLVNLSIPQINDYEFMNLTLVAASFPVPVLTLNELQVRSKVLSYRSLLNNKSGVYGFINLKNGKIYIGSGFNIYRRFLDHIAGRASNLLLQRAFKKYGLESFSFVVYEFCSYEISGIIEAENKYISYFPFEMLYNLTPAAGSLYGYKHTEEAKAKMKLYYINKNNHPMYNKTHTSETKAIISKPGLLNPMYGKKHTAEARAKISDRLSNPITLYDNNNQYILTFKNSVQLSEFIGCFKGTIGRYLKSGKCYKGLYYFRTN